MKWASDLTVGVSAETPTVKYTLTRRIFQRLNQNASKNSACSTHVPVLATLLVVSSMFQEHIVKAYRIASGIGVLVAVLAWGAKAALLLEMMRTGEINPLGVLLLVIAVISLVVGGVRVQFGRTGRVPFVLHVVFATTATLLMHFVLPVPLALSLSVAVAAFVWSFAARQGA